MVGGAGIPRRESDTSVKLSLAQSYQALQHSQRALRMLSRQHSMMLVDEQRASQVLALGRRRRCWPGLLLRLWFVAHMGRVAGDSLFYGEIAKTLAATRRIWRHRSRPNPRLLSWSAPSWLAFPAIPSSLPPAFRLFGMEDYHHRAECAGFARRSGHLLSGQRAGRTPLPAAATVVGFLWLAALCPSPQNLHLHGPPRHSYSPRLRWLFTALRVGRTPDREPTAGYGPLAAALFPTPFCCGPEQVCWPRRCCGRCWWRSF